MFKILKQLTQLLQTYRELSHLEHFTHLTFEATGYLVNGTLNYLRVLHLAHSRQMFNKSVQYIVCHSQSGYIL